MQRLARAEGPDDALRARALRQAGRELLLAQASDWAFILKTGTLIPYAVRRTESHLDRFERLAASLESGALDAEEIASIEEADPVFPDLDPGLFA
jgi:1,4-alpha-glucan branching enzyme